MIFMHSSTPEMLRACKGEFTNLTAQCHVNHDKGNIPRPLFEYVSDK